VAHGPLVKIMAPKGQVGQMEMKCLLIFEKYFHKSQCYSGERCGPWVFCLLIKCQIPVVS
jgi:hypothetical protein